MTISTHVLDTSAGAPAVGVAVSLEHHDGRRWLPVGEGRTNSDGRVIALVTGDVPLPGGKYRLVFEVGPYFASREVETFYPRVVVEFVTHDAGHYHVPLLISPFGYTTYRGS